MQSHSNFASLFTSPLLQVQDIVVGNKSFTDVAKPSEIVQLLLNDEQLATLDTSAAPSLSSKQTGKQCDGEEPVRDLWNDEGDDFFGHSGPAATTGIVPEAGEDENGTPIPSARGKKRKPGAAGVTRGRKSTGKRKSGTSTEMVTPAGETA